MDLPLFSRTEPFRKDFFARWSKHLRDVIIPFLRESLTSAVATPALSSDVKRVLYSLETYYETLNYHTNTTPYLVFSSWRNSLETPFLLLGDIHPYILTSLLRSFVIQENHVSDETLSHLGISTYHPRKIDSPWKNPSDKLLKKLDEIECEMKSMVPPLLERMCKAQILFVTRVSEDWISANYSQEAINRKAVAATSSMAADEVAVSELVNIFQDANHLRFKAIKDIVHVMDNLQATTYLEALCNFLVGLTDQDQAEDKRPILDHIPRQHLNSATSNEGSVFVIYVGGLDAGVTKGLLLDAFKERYPSAKHAKVITHQDTGRCKGYGFVGFENVEEQQRDLMDMEGEGHVLLNKRMFTRPAQGKTIF